MKLTISVLFILLLISFTDSVYSQNIDEKYSKVKIHFQNYKQIKELASDGLILDHPFYEKDRAGFTLTVILNTGEKNILSNSGFYYEVLSKDVIKDFNKREKLSLLEQKEIQSVYKVSGFEFGSMGGFYTFDEVIAELDSMQLLYPNLITIKDSIGSSNESRAIWAVKISDNPNVDEDEPEVLYTSLHHAREPGSMMTNIYFMYYLLENYGSDPEVTYIVDNRELHFIPVVNPDGYVYNEQTYPGGGGMWRKNRRVNEDSTYGVDLNRNYGYKWGYNDLGSSSDPNSNVFRGTSPFSEPETQAVRDYCTEHNFVLALNYHTYSNLLIYPWGYSSTLTPDSTIFIQYASEMTKYNNYTFGTGEETVGYLVNGDADDWMYGEQDIKNKILAMTPEVGNGNDGFWPLQSRIYPLAEENIYPNMLLAKFAGGFVQAVDYKITEIGDSNGYVDPGEEGFLLLRIKNIGQGESENASLSIVGADSFITFTNPAEIQITSLLSQEEINVDSIRFTVSEDTPVGYSANIIYKITQNGIEKKDTIKNIMFGTPEILLFENADSLFNWEMDGIWDTTSKSYFSQNYSFTDSPNGNYKNNTDISMTLKNPVDLSADSMVYLEYWTKWQIETNWDFAQVYASIDSITWEPLKGNLMIKGSGNNGSVQPSNQYGYHGFQSTWVKESIDISNYSGNSKFYIRFSLKSDEYIEFDGWYIDDIIIKTYGKRVTDVKYNPPTSAKYELFQNYPNPFNPTTTIKYSIPSSVISKSGTTRNLNDSKISPSGRNDNVNVTLKVYDILGREIATLVNEKKKAGIYEINFDASEYSSGIYFYRIQVDNFKASRKMLILK